MKRIWTIGLIFALLLTTSVLVAQEDMMEQPLLGFWDECPAPTGLPETVTLGAIFGLSGPIGVYGNPQQQSVQLAVDEINQSGYLGEGVTLEVIFEDSTGDAEQAIAAMTKLVEEDGVVGVIGPTLSTEAFAADPIAEENGTVVMGVSNTAIGITDMGEFVFRNSLPEAAVIPGTISQAAAALGLENVGILYGNDDDFTISGYDVFVLALADNDINILGEETFARGDVDFSAQLTNLISQEPDAIVASALAAEAIQIINQARELGYEGPIIGGNGFNSPAVLAQTGENAEGLIVGAAWNVENPENNEASLAFTAMFEEANAALPDQFAAQAYTGAWLMATAVRCADSVDRSAVRDALAGITEFNSPLGNFSFDEDRNPLHDPVAQIVVEGVFVPLTAGE
jgi:branched-chain amino acid transport system substrate-binding protein